MEEKNDFFFHKHPECIENFPQSIREYCVRNNNFLLLLFLIYKRFTQNKIWANDWGNKMNAQIKSEYRLHHFLKKSLRETSLDERIFNA